MSESRERPTAVVDTNLFVSGAISPIGSPRRLLRAWYDEQFVLLLSDAHRAEVVDVPTRPRVVKLFQLSAEEIDALFAAIGRATRVSGVTVLPVPVRDPKDEKILAAALGGDADYLVSGDRDLLSLGDDPRLGRLKIVTVVDFLAVLGEDVPSAQDD